MNSSSLIKPIALRLSRSPINQRLFQAAASYQSPRLSCCLFSTYTPLSVSRPHARKSQSSRSKSGSTSMREVTPLVPADHKPPKIEYRGNKFVQVDNVSSGPGDESVEDKDPLPVPVPTKEYLEQSAKEPQLLDQPRRLFVVLDLNRTLIYRPRDTREFIRRPHLEPFMETIVTDHNAMIWTTSKPTTVRTILPVALKGRVRRKLCEVLDRSSFNLNRVQYFSKTQVYKELDRIWNDKTLQRKREEQTKTVRKKLPQTKIIRGWWNQSNTILIDDSWQKAAKQPYNLLEVPAFTDSNAGDEVTLRMVLRQLRVLSWYDDVSCKIREWIELRNKTFSPKPDGTPWTLNQDDYDWFWDRVVMGEEKKLGLEPYVFPPPPRKMGVKGSDSESGSSGED